MPSSRFLTFGLFAVLAVPAFAQPPAMPDEHMKAVLDELAALNNKKIEDLSPAEARKQPGPPDAVKSLLKKRKMSTDPEPVGAVKDLEFQGPGGKLPLRVYTPKGDGPFPVVVYWHGGGFVIADIAAYDSSCRALCNAAGAVVVSCEYRRAPEHKYPAAHDDAFAAYEWVLKNAKDIKGDPKRIAVAGESAGGNLAASTTISARDKKLQLPVHMLLVYPVTDDDMETQSYRQYADAKPLNKPMLKWFFGHYLKDPVQAKDTRVSVNKTKDLTGLPPTTIILAQIDPLYSDGVKFGGRLMDAGVPTKIIGYEGVAHEFFGMGAAVPKAKLAVADAAAGLKMGFATAK